MADIQTQLATMSTSAKPRDSRVFLEMPPSNAAALSQATAARLRDRLAIEAYSPVNQNGSFEFDRVIKSGYVQKRTQKTKTWRTIYLVLRPNTLSIYKSDKEEKLRHKVYLSDLTAVAMLKDPKNKRPGVFGLFSPSKNYHFQAPSLAEAQDWVELIRQDARIEEEEEEMFLASPAVQHPSSSFFANAQAHDAHANAAASAAAERLASSSPEPLEPPVRTFASSYGRRPSQLESSGLSGTELASHSDFSDSEVQRIPGTSLESLAVQPHAPISIASPAGAAGKTGAASSQAGLSNSPAEAYHDPDRVVWQGWMWLLRSKGGVRQWKKAWGVVRPRNFILYKDDSESSVLFLVYMSSIVNVVDIDPVSRTKMHCLQVITDEKSYRFCAADEEGLVRCLGAFKSLLAKRRELEARAAGAGSTTAVLSGGPALAGMPASAAVVAPATATA